MLYLAAQVPGALLVRFGAGAGLVGEPGASYAASPAAAEFIGSGILLITGAATTDERVAKAGSGIAMGGALLAGLLLSHGVLNPAVGPAVGPDASPTVWALLLSAVVFSLLFAVMERTAPAEARPDKLAAGK